MSRKVKFIRPGWVAVLLVVAALPLIGLQLHKNITFIENDDSRRVTTFALTTGQLLNELHVSLGPKDLLDPGVDEWLQEAGEVRLVRASSVIILDGPVTHHLFTTGRTPRKWLAEAGVEFDLGDEIQAGGSLVLPDQVLPLSPHYLVSIRRAVRVVLLDGSHRYTFDSTAATVGQALWQAGYLLSAADRLHPPPETPLSGEEVQIELTRSRELIIQVGNNEVKARTSAAVVGEALAENGLALQWLDYTIPAENDPLPPDGLIRLVRVKEDIVIDQTPVPFEVEYQPDPDLEIDNQRILTPGEYGLTARRVRVRYEDGVEVSRQVEGDWLAREPQNQVVGYGTNIVMRSLDTPDGTIYYWRALTFWITSYSDKVGTITASGQRVRKGLVGVNPYYIPYGTMMYVPNYGYAEAADTGNLTARWIDLGYTADEYIPWHEYSTVYFLWPPPAHVLWIYPP